MTKDEALKLAFEALENYPAIGLAISGADAWNQCQKAITAIKEALAQPTSGDYALGYAEGFNDACKRQPERTGWPAGLLQDDDRKLSKWLASKPDAKHVVNMAQPEQEPVGFAVMERPWVGLTDEERGSVLDSVPPDNMGGEYYDKEITAIAIAIEAKLMEKNT